MVSWKKVLAHRLVKIEDSYDMLKYRLRERLGGRDPIMILPYRGFGTREKVFIKGRVLENKNIQSAMDDDTLWEHLLNMYKRFESDEIPYARVMVSMNGIEEEVVTDEEGFFETWIAPSQHLPGDKLWHELEIELLSPLRKGYPPVHATGEVLVPPENAEFGVISDIDDTVIHTDATHLLRMARTVFLGSAQTRLPFKGVAAFYRALLKGSRGNSINPIFYVSSSPWNMYDLLSDFFHLQDIPLGPVLFLRDWGLSEEELIPAQHRSHKLKAIERVIDLYQELPFILIGDSGQEDPEIYQEVVELYPNRILAIYIRNVNKSLKRAETIRQLAKKILEAHSTLILAEDTLPMAEHAAQKGWIQTAALPEITEEKKADEAPPGPLEKLLGEEEEPEKSTVAIEGETTDQAKEAVEGGAIETSIDEARKKKEGPPTVVVKGDED